MLVTFSMLSMGKVYAYNATGNEDRCESLGANCVCSEPMNTGNLVLKGNQYNLDPTDTTAKECSVDGVPGGAIVGNNGSSNPADFIVADNNSGVLAALPSGNVVNWYVRGAKDNVGSSYAIFFVGHIADQAKYLKRFAWRYYVYHPPGNQFTDKAAGCSNTKWAQGPVTSSITAAPNNSASINNYAQWNNWTYANGTKVVGDCCWAGPPNKNAVQPMSFFNGKWLRVEGIVTNRAGGASPNGFTFKVYMKNITDGTPEIKVVDTTIYDPGVGPNSGWLGADDVTPPSAVRNFFINNYREGDCKGYRAMSHYMAAGWDTDNGQRIGSAKEVEGVMGQTGGTATLLPNPGAGWDPQPNASMSP